MEATDIKVKNFTGSSYGIFEDGKFITSNDGWDKMIERATIIANEGVSKVTISTLGFAGTDEEPIVKEGTVIMKFYKIDDTVYITSQFGKSSVSCPLKPSDSAPLKHSTMPP